jgi:hypothetical protein
MFSKPLAYPSALDHRLASRPASYVEELWSPIPERLSEKSTQKHTHHFLRYFQRQAPSDLSLSGGASIRSRSSSS